MAEESTETMQAQIHLLEERVKALEEDVKAANLLASVAKRQRSLGG